MANLLQTLAVVAPFIFCFILFNLVEIGLGYGFLTFGMRETVVAENEWVLRALPSAITTLFSLQLTYSTLKAPIASGKCQSAFVQPRLHRLLINDLDPKGLRLPGSILHIEEVGSQRSRQFLQSIQKLISA